jgi:hypothetical protein
MTRPSAAPYAVVSHRGYVDCFGVCGVLGLVFSTGFWALCFSALLSSGCAPYRARLCNPEATAASLPWSRSFPWHVFAYQRRVRFAISSQPEVYTQCPCLWRLLTLSRALNGITLKPATGKRSALFSVLKVDNEDRAKPSRLFLWPMLDSCKYPNRCRTILPRDRENLSIPPSEPTIHSATSACSSAVWAIQVWPKFCNNPHASQPPPNACQIGVA